jgi:hypothetical protein
LQSLLIGSSSMVTGAPLQQVCLCNLQWKTNAVSMPFQS